MDRRKILDILFENVKYTKEEKEILYALEEAREEWEMANRYFQVIDQPDLVDYAIHKENAAKAKYMHYLSRARELGITVDPVYMIEEC